MPARDIVFAHELSTYADGNLGNADVIIIWVEGDGHYSMMARLCKGGLLWNIRLANTIRYCVFSYGIINGEPTFLSKEDFFNWLEDNHPQDYEWCLWNLNCFDKR